VLTSAGSSPAAGHLPPLDAKRCELNTFGPMIGQEGRLRLLVDTGIALSQELSLAAVLQRLVEAAAAITDAHYAALGVIDRTGRGLEQFVTTGISPDMIDEIGELPVGRGILGVLIRDAKPLRLRDLGEDPRAVGFPPGHPPMRTFLGVPILLRDIAYGNLYLTEKEDGEEFTEEDEELVLLLAAQAAVAIENARLYESATRWLRQLETMTEVGNALASETDLQTLLTLIAGRLRELLGARMVVIALPAPDGDLVIETVDHEGAQHAGRMRLTRAGSKAMRVLERRRPERVDLLIEDLETDRDALRRLAELTGLPVPSTGLYVPLIIHDRPVGAIAIHDKIGGSERDLRFTDEDLRLAEWFGQRVAVGVDLSQRVQRDALQRVVAAQELERKRLARELHDETGQALTSILLGLRALEETDDPEGVRTTAAALREMTVQTLQDVRRLAVELRPSALDDFGLVPAIERLLDGFRAQTGLVVHLETQIEERLPGEVETSLYRIVQEALTNIIKHARARHVSVLITRRDSTVSAVIEDDGRGFAPDDIHDGLGLLGMRERLALLNGTLIIESAPGRGTTLVAEVPVS
jgi:signal transduction histidine kinase